jgi:hypothetical protein
MSNKWAATTDHFSLADTDLKLISNSKIPRGDSNRADALTEDGDIDAAEWHGEAAEPIYDLECEYELQSGTLDLADIAMGYQSAGLAITSLKLDTSNGAWPKLTVSGASGLLNLDTLATWTLPTLEVDGKKRAQLLGFTIAEGCRLSGSSFEFGLELSESTDGSGVPGAHALSSNDAAKIGAEGQSVTTAGAWTLTLSGLTETQPPGVVEPQADWHTWSAEAELVIARDTPPA